MMTQTLDRSSVAAGGTILPSDAVYEILLRLPARTLCRFRVVCRSWRVLTTDPVFIQAHETSHLLEPLLVVANNGGDDIHTMDLAGNVVKKMCSTHVTRAAGPCRHLGPMCLVRTPTSVGILDLAAGTVYASFSADGVDCMTARYRASYALGRSPSTGEYKLLRIRVPHPIMDSRHEQRCDVFTLLDDGSSRHGWRRRRSPPVNVRLSCPIHDVVIDGVAYFLSDHIANADHEPDAISSFNLETEEWGSAALRGPLSSHGLLDNADDDIEENEYGMGGYIGLRCELGLGKANGWLVTTRNRWRDDSSVDLWFLKDINSGVWVKQFKIQKLWPLVPRPLMVLDDGRIVFSVEVVSASDHALQLCDESSTPNVVIVRTYDPRTNETRDVARMQGKEIVGVYAGASLLHPKNI